MESDFSQLESAIFYKFLMFQKIPYRERLLPSFYLELVTGFGRLLTFVLDGLALRSEMEKTATFAGF